jgi:predicted Zn-dependent protease
METIIQYEGSGSPSDPFVKAAIGFLELGDPYAAWDELEQIPAEYRAESIVLVMRYEVYMALERWDEAVEIAQHLVKTDPSEPMLFVNLAMAEVKKSGYGVAEGILREALKAFPHHPNINYNLACYSAQLGKVEEAKRLLAIAIELDPIFREASLEDEDLVGIW